jgi:dipeptidyl aminopeptidase/acylaminoacyl peptidase
MGMSRIWAPLMSRGVSAQRITNQNLAVSALAWSRERKVRAVQRLAQTLAGSLYLWIAEIDRRRPPLRLEIAGPLAYNPSVSPVGNRLVFQRNLRDYDIWRYRVGGLRSNR